MSSQEHTNRIKAALALLLPSCVVVLNLFFFTPITIYAGNISEFSISLPEILKCFAIPALVLLGLFMGIGLLLRRKYFPLLVSFLLALGILMWVQSSYFVLQHGPMGITDINWSKYVWQSILNAAMWIVVLSVGLLLHRRILRAAVVMSCSLLAVQFTYLCILSIQEPKLWTKKEEVYKAISPPTELMQFSSTENVIHVVLDELQSTVFKEFTNENQESYANDFEGFTFFEEATGAFPTTLMSVPALLSGETYKNHVPIQDFMRSICSANTLPNVLYDHGFKVDFAVPYHWCYNGKWSVFYYIPVPYGLSKEEYDQANADSLLRFSVFRLSPHFLKMLIYKYGVGIPMINLTKGDRQHWEAARHFAHEEFLQDLIDNMQTTRDGSVYKFIHLTTTHWPAVLDGNCKYAGRVLPWTWENIKMQARCGIAHFLRFLEKLRHLGIYDSSLIIVQADHGYWKIPRSEMEVTVKNAEKDIPGYFSRDPEYFAEMVCSALPLMAIKPPHRQGPLRVSSIPAALTDIPATVCSLLGIEHDFSGEAVFELNDNERRKRVFRYYDTLNRSKDKFFRRMDEFHIEGSPFDKASWKFISSYRNPEELSYEVRELDFGTQDAFHFLNYGWGPNEKDPREGYSFNWTIGESAGLLLSLPKNREAVLTAVLQSFPFDTMQEINIFVDGEQVGRWELSHPWRFCRKSVIIPSNEKRPDVSHIEFQFSKKRMSTKGERPISVRFKRITID